MSSAGWFPQPDGQERYFDGETWTDDYRPAQWSQSPQPTYAPAPPPPANGQAPPPRKEGSPWKWVVIIVAIVLFVCCCGFAGWTTSLTNGTDDARQPMDADEASKAMESRESGPGGVYNPMTITEGEPFVVGDLSYSAGWKVTQFLGHADITGLKVTNNNDYPNFASVEIKLLKDGYLLAVVGCSTGIDEWETSSVTCFTTDKLPDDYDEITINDAF